MNKFELKGIVDTALEEQNIVCDDLRLRIYDKKNSVCIDMYEVRSDMDPRLLSSRINELVLETTGSTELTKDSMELMPVPRDVYAEKARELWESDSGRRFSECIPDPWLDITFRLSWK